MNHTQPISSSKVHDTVLRMRNGAQTAGGHVFRFAKLAQENAHYIAPAFTGLIHKDLRPVAGLQLGLSFRANGRDIGVQELHQLKSGSHDVVVFLHGLMGNEVPWYKAARDRVAYGPKMAEDHHITPLYVRYDSGRHISTNGKDLSRLLEDMYHFYHGTIRSIRFVCHSMGGLLIQSAGHYALNAGYKWPLQAEHVVLLAAPNLGAPLEKFGHLATMVLDNLFNVYTKALSKVINQRSDGIKDLRYGYVVDEDWLQDKRSILSPRTPVHPLPKAKYTLVGGTLASDPFSKTAMISGDGMISVKSATTLHTVAEPPYAVSTRVFADHSHVGLMMSPEVYAYICEFMFGRSEADKENS